MISATLLPQKKKPSTKKPDKQSAARKGATRRGLPEEHALTADEQSQKITQAKKFLAMLPALFEAQDYSGMRALAGRIQRALQEKFTLPDLDAQKQEILGKVDIAQRRARIHEDFLNRDITISAIIYEENARSVAIINGQSVEIGDSIGDDISVDAIHKNSVVFRYRGERIRKNF